MLKKLSIILLIILIASHLQAQNEGKGLSLVLKPKGHKGLIKDFSIYEAGGFLISAGRDKTIKLWDTETYESRGELLGHIGPSTYGTLFSTRVSPNGQYLVSTGLFGEDGHAEYRADLRVYDFKTRKVIKALSGHQNIINQIRWSPDSQYLVSASSDHTIGIWDMNKLENKTMLEGHGADVWCVDIHGDKVVSGSKDNLVKLWDINTGSNVATSYDHFGEISAVAFHPSGNYIISGAEDSQINVFDATLNFMDMVLLDQSISYLSFNATGNILMAGLYNGSISVFSFENGSLTEKVTYQPHEGAYVAGVAMLSDQRIVSAGGIASNIAVYQYQNGQLDSLANISGSTQKVQGAGLNGDLLAFSTDAKRWRSLTGLRDVDFSHGFNLVSREYDQLDETERIYKGGVNAVFKEQTAYFHGKAYDFKVPITKLGGLVATKNKDAVLVKYEPNIDYSSQLEQEGRYTGLQWGEVLFNHYNDKVQKYSIAFTPDSLLMVAGTAGYLKAFNLDGEVVTILEGHEDIVFSVNMSTDNRWVISGSHDQSIRLWDTKRLGKEKLINAAATCFFSKEGEWMIVTEEGYYMSSTHGGKYVGFHQNQGFRAEAKFYPFENFDLKYNRPDKVLEKLALGSTGLHELLYKAYQKRIKKMGLREEDISGEINLPSLTIAGASQTTTNKQYLLELTATDMVRPLDRINIYVNDIPLFGIKGISVKDEKNRNKISKQLKVELMKGRNKIQVSAMNIAGIESLKETTNIFYEGDSPKPDLHVVAIGVSNYKDSEYNLTYAKKDADDVSKLFQSHQGQYNKIHIHKFTDLFARKEMILAVKDKLNQTKVEDEVIVFVAGHGLLDENLDYYFATQDIDFDNPSVRGLKYESLEGLLDGIPARQKLMFIDACHSGEVDKEDTQLIASSVSKEEVSTRGFKTKPKPVGMDNIFQLMQELFADLRRGTGATVISSASGVEFAYESAQWSNGVFTFALLEGLGTGKCDQNKDGNIQVSEIRNYVFDRVVELTNGKQHPTSRRENLENDFVVW